MLPDKEWAGKVSKERWETMDACACKEVCESPSSFLPKRKPKHERLGVQVAPQPKEWMAWETEVCLEWLILLMVTVCRRMQRWERNQKPADTVQRQEFWEIEEDRGTVCMKKWNTEKSHKSPTQRVGKSKSSPIGGRSKISDQIMSAGNHLKGSMFQAKVLKGW